MSVLAPVSVQVPPPEVLLQVQYQIYRGLWMDDHFDELQKAGVQASPAAAATQTKSSPAAAAIARRCAAELGVELPATASAAP
mgnify:CR=1 FL=1